MNHMKRAAFFLSFALCAAVVPALAQDSGEDITASCVGGKPNAPVKIEVFSDFECPACQRFYLGTVRQVLADYSRTNKVCVVYREFPLPMHQHSRKAARYAVAARRLGTWQWIQVTDRLYLDQGQWAQTGDVEAVVAKALSAEDMARVKKLLDDPSIDQAIDGDVALGHRQKVTQTPTFFVTANGKTERVSGVVQYAVLRDYLESVLPR